MSSASPSYHSGLELVTIYILSLQTQKHSPFCDNLVHSLPELHTFHRDKKKKKMFIFMAFEYKNQISDF